MSNPNKINQQNKLIVSEEVVAKIVGVAAKDVEGVAALTCKPNDFKSVFARKKATSSANITVSNGAMNIDVYVTLKAGVKIPEVCANVQEAVKSSVQNITGKPVARVNVEVVDIAFDEE